MSKKIENDVNTYHQLYERKVEGFNKAQCEHFKQVKKFFKEEFTDALFPLLQEYESDNNRPLEITVIDSYDNKEYGLKMTGCMERSETIRLQLMDPRLNEVVKAMYIRNILHLNENDGYIKYSDPADMDDFIKKVKSFESDKRLFDLLKSNKDKIISKINQYNDTVIKNKIDILNGFPF